MTDATQSDTPQGRDNTLSTTVESDEEKMRKHYHDINVTMGKHNVEERPYPIPIPSHLLNMFLPILFMKVISV